MNAQVSAKTLT